MLKHQFIRVAATAILIALSACSTLTELRSDMADKVFGREPANPPAELKELTPSYGAKVDWSSHIGATDRYDYTPALAANEVYAANSAGDLVKFDGKTGHELWRVKAGEPISGGVGVGGGLALVGTNKGNVIAFDVTGKLLWKAKVSSEVLSAPRYFDGMVIVRTGDSHIFGLDAADGTRKWVYDHASPALSIRSSAGIIVDGGAVYAGFSGGKMVAIRADNGKLLWEATVAQPKGVTEIERIADITSLPVVDGPVVFAVAYQGKVAAIDRLSGRVIWNRDISSYSGIAIEDGRLYVSHTLGSIYSLDYETSKTFWRQPGLLNRRISTPLAMGSIVAVGDLEGYVHFLNREDGSFAARIKVDSEPVMSIAQGTSSSQLIVATRGGGLYAVSVAEITAPSPATKSEKSSQPTPAAEPDSNAPQGERSILFKNDPILLPDTQPNTNSGPGIVLPNSESQ